MSLPTTPGDTEIGNMNEEPIQQTEETFDEARSFQGPAYVHGSTLVGLAKTREVFDKFLREAVETGKAYERAGNVAQDGARILTDKSLKNLEANMLAAFDGLLAMTRAKNLPEAIAIQTDLTTKAVADLSQQMRELGELAGKVTTDTSEAVKAAASKTLEPVTFG
jgi:hypothetical protein